MPFVCFLFFADFCLHAATLILFIYLKLTQPTTLISSNQSSILSAQFVSLPKNIFFRKKKEKENLAAFRVFLSLVFLICSFPLLCSFLVHLLIKALCSNPNSSFLQNLPDSLKGAFDVNCKRNKLCLFCNQINAHLFPNHVLSLSDLDCSLSMVLALKCRIKFS